VTERTKLAALSGLRETGAPQSRAQSPSDAASSESKLAVANRAMGRRAWLGREARIRVLPPKSASQGVDDHPQDERRSARRSLDAALEEFAELGLHGASSEDIARRAGISQPYVFRLFATKKELFSAVAPRPANMTVERSACRAPCAARLFPLPASFLSHVREGDKLNTGYRDRRSRFPAPPAIGSQRPRSAVVLNRRAVYAQCKQLSAMTSLDGVARMARISVRLRSLDRSLVLQIWRNDAVWPNSSERVRTPLRVDKLGVTGSSPVPPILTLGGMREVASFQGSGTSGMPRKRGWCCPRCCPQNLPNEARRCHGDVWATRPRPANRRNVGCASGRLRAVQVDDERPFSDERDDELLRLVERVHVPVDEPDGHVEETALLHLRALRAARPEFEAEATPDDVPEHFAISVVMPTRHDTTVDTTADVERAIRRKCDLPDDARRRVALRQAVWCNRRDSIS
jgi:hypothetical protein